MRASPVVANDAGYSDLKTLIEQGRRVLKPGGYLWMEHGHQPLGA